MDEQLISQFVELAKKYQANAESQVYLASTPLSVLLFYKALEEFKRELREEEKAIG